MGARTWPRPRISLVVRVLPMVAVGSECGAPARDAAGFAPGPARLRARPGANRVTSIAYLGPMPTEPGLARRHGAATAAAQTSPMGGSVGGGSSRTTACWPRLAWPAGRRGRLHGHFGWAA